MRAPAIAVVVVVGLIVAACGSAANVDGAGRDSSSGVITRRGNVGIQRLRVGDCFVDPAGSSTQIVLGVPCADAHDSQVVAIIDLPDGSSVEWPGDVELVERARSLCFDSAVVALDGNLTDVTIGISVYVPDRGSWEAGDRRVVCTLGRFDGSSLTGSLLGRST